MASSPSLAKDLSSTEKRALLAELLRKKASGNIERHPLSHGQKVVAHSYRRDSSDTTYNIVFVSALSGPVDSEALQSAVKAIVTKHSILRTTYELSGDEWQQKVHPEMEFEFEAADVSTLLEQQLNDRIEAEGLRPYDLGKGPLLRIKLFSRSSADHLLVIGAHHIAFDIWSYHVFTEELAGHYHQARSGALPEQKPARQFTDYVAWQRSLLASKRGEELEKFWEGELSGELPVLNLTIDRPRPAAQSSERSSVRFDFGETLSERLRLFAPKEDSTPFLVCLTAFQVLMHRYTHQDDIIVGTPVASRSKQEFENLIGFFANLVPIRCNMSGNPQFRTLLKQVRRTVLKAIEHHEYPFVLLAEKFAGARDASRPPLIDVAFSWEKAQKSQMESATPNSLDLELLFARQMGAPYDLTFLVFEGASLSSTVLYNTVLFEPTTVMRMLEHLRHLVDTVISDPACRIDEIDFLTDAEYAAFSKRNRTEGEFPHESCLHQLFEEHALNSPQAVAVWCEGVQLTYDGLNRRANQLAHLLAGKGVGPEVLVGISLERSIEMLVAILAVMKAGGAYVPLDPGYPAERLAYMLRDSHAKVLLTQTSLLDRLPQHGSELICLDEASAELSGQPVTNLDSGVGPKNLAYVIYTSGSTGMPKGVLVEHRGLSNLGEAQSRMFDLRRDERVLQFASLSFDASIFEISMAIKKGSTLFIATGESCLSGDALFRFLQAQRITNVTLPPSMVSMMPAGQLADLRTMLVAGEACPANIVLHWATGRKFYNLYGPTETTVWATGTQCTPDMQRPHIGKPILNTTIELLDYHQHRVALGVPGELCIGGAGLARGYLNRPELTAEKFIRNPFSSDADSRLYRTGDLARYLPDGNLEFLGRIDHQIKIRGLRVELGEIEAALAAYPNVADAAVMVKEDEGGSKRLVACVVSKTDPAPPASELREYLRNIVPAHMVPAAFAFLNAMPLSPNGKVDRKSLGSVEEETLLAKFIPPEAGLEKEIAEVWCAALNREKIGRFDNFFDLGGHSLLIGQMHKRIEEVVKRKVPIVDLFRFPTISSFTRNLGQAQSQENSFTDVRERARQQRNALAARAQQSKLGRRPNE
jgi:amino acid adenylation domain-containing protein